MEENRSLISNRAQTLGRHGGKKAVQGFRLALSCLPVLFFSLIRMPSHQTENSLWSSASPEEASDDEQWQTVHKGLPSTWWGVGIKTYSLSPATWAQPSVRVFSHSTWEKPLFQGTFLHKRVRSFSRTNQPCGKWQRHFQANWFFLTGLQVQRTPFFSLDLNLFHRSVVCSSALGSVKLRVRCSQKHNGVASLCSGQEKGSRHIPKETQFLWVAAAAKSLQSCPTLCDPIDGSPPGSPIPGTLQARTLEWVAISFSNAWKWKVKVKSLSRARLCVTPWTAAYQAPPSMGFSRQEYWSGVPLPSLSVSGTWPQFTSSIALIKRLTLPWQKQQRCLMVYLYVGLSQGTKNRKLPHTNKIRGNI